MSLRAGTLGLLILSTIIAGYGNYPGGAATH